jgi:hypothetical protein
VEMCRPGVAYFEIITVKIISRGISYDFDQKKYMFWKLVNSFKMMK